MKSKSFCYRKIVIRFWYDEKIHSFFSFSSLGGLSNYKDLNKLEIDTKALIDKKLDFIPKSYTELVNYIEENCLNVEDYNDFSIDTDLFCMIVEKFINYRGGIAND